MVQRRKSPTPRLHGARKQQKLVRFPHELAERSTRTSKELGISNNEFIVRAVSAYLQALCTPAPDDIETGLEAEHGVAEAILDAVRAILRTEIGAASGALATKLGEEIAAVLGPLRAEIASVINGGLRSVQDQVSNLIADSILAGDHTHRLESPVASNPPELRSMGVTPLHQPVSGFGFVRPPARSEAERGARKTNTQDWLAMRRQHAPEFASGSQPSGVPAAGVKKGGG